MVNRKIDPETTFTGLMVGSISLQGLVWPSLYCRGQPKMLEKYVYEMILIIGEQLPLLALSTYRSGKKKNHAEKYFWC